MRRYYHLWKNKIMEKIEINSSINFIVAFIILTISCESKSKQEIKSLDMPVSLESAIVNNATNKTNKTVFISETVHADLFAIVIFEEQSDFNPKEFYVRITQIFNTPFNIKDFNESSVVNEQIGIFLGTRQHGRIFSKFLKRFDTKIEAEEYKNNFNKDLRRGGREALSNELTLDTIPTYEEEVVYESFTDEEFNKQKTK